MKKVLLFIVVSASLFVCGLLVLAKKSSAPDIPQTIKTKASTQTTENITKTPSFNRKTYSTTTPGSLWWVVNKQSAAGAYIPPDLVKPTIPIRSSAGSDERKVRQEMTTALESLVNAGEKAGIKLMLASGYRSYATQATVYANEVKNYGQTQADRESARPGHSEHQTGWAADLEDAGRKCEVADCFGNLPEGKWLAAHGYEYGFIIRYPDGKESVTGYRYEPWHVRYVGVDLATEMHRLDVKTLEEFFSQ